MGEQDKITGEFSRMELAEHLETLAKKLRLGKFRLKDQDRRVPDRLEAKIKVKEKRGEVGVKVHFQFPVLAAYDEATAAEIVQRQMSFKEVKKKLGHVFGELLRALTLVAFPQEATVQQYLDLSQELARYADPAWAAEMQEYLDHTENLRLAFQNRQFEMFQHELRDLQNRMKICHREFK
jgi:XXXCH domain-containing protein